MANENVEPIIKSTTDARQGVTGHNVRYVLAWSMIGAVALLAIVYFVLLHNHSL